jgi:hypothetical protein
MESNIVIIACSIFKTEIENLRTDGKINVPVIYLNSMLHMYPRQLNEILDKKIEDNRNLKIILVFGDCHARMVDYENNKNIMRTPGINCCEILLGQEKYKTLRKEGAFILLPEWAERWEEVFRDYMGFKSSENASEFMAEMHKKLVFVNTSDKIEENTQNEITAYIRLPYEIISCSITELEHSILNLIETQLSNSDNGR